MRDENRVEISNPMIAAALAKGEDATGLATVRELASLLIHFEERRQAEDGMHDFWELPLECEMVFNLPGGYVVNAEVRVTGIEKEAGDERGPI